MTARLCLAFLCLAAASFADPAKPSDVISLFDGKSLGAWEKVDIGGSGDVVVEDGELLIDQSDGLSGCVYKDSAKLPMQNYEISLQAQRVRGSDFFCGLTFPVGDAKTALTLVLGGWGGGIVGLSNIDGLDASENSTSTVMGFKDETWYKVRVKVTPTDITVWIDDKEIIAVDTMGKKLSLRPGPIESYPPISLTTYATAAAFKDIKITKLK